jgi:DNA-directed RNA polymerase specialized sigma24 family protein
LGELLLESKKGSYYEYGELSQYIRDIAHSYFQVKYDLKKITKIEDVEELTNNVFLAFSEEYRKIENIGYWMRRVLFISFIRLYKKNKTKSSMKMKDNIFLDEDHSQGFKLMAANTLRVLDSLSEEKQKIVRLKLWADLNFEEIALHLRKGINEVIKIFADTMLVIKARLR